MLNNRGHLPLTCCPQAWWNMLSLVLQKIYLSSRFCMCNGREATSCPLPQEEHILGWPSFPLPRLLVHACLCKFLATLYHRTIHEIEKLYGEVTSVSFYFKGCIPAILFTILVTLCGATLILEICESLLQHDPHVKVIH